MRHLVRPRIPVILGIAAIALCALSLAGPWFSVDVRGTDNVLQMNWEYRLFTSSWTGPTIATPKGQTVTVVYNYSLQPRTASVFLAATALEGSGLVLGIGVLAAHLGSRSRPHLGSWAAWIALTACTLNVVAPLAVMAFFPTAQASDMNGLDWVTTFWGSKSFFSRETGEGIAFWGAGWAWYLSLTAAGLFLVTAIVLLRARGDSRAAFASPETPGRIS